MENQQIQTINSEPRFLPTYKPNSITEIVKISKEVLSIARLKKDFPLMLDIVTDTLKLTILDVFDFYNEPLKDSQQLNSLIEACKQVGYMTNGGDWQLFKTNCLNGVYPLKFRLTPPVFIEWLKLYIADRVEVFVAENSKPPAKTEQEINHELKVLKVFTEKRQQIEKDWEVKLNERFVQQVENRPVDLSKQLQKFIETEFEKISVRTVVDKVVVSDTKSQEVLMDCKPYVQIKNSRLNKIDYTTYRFNQIYEDCMKEFDKITLANKSELYSEFVTEYFLNIIQGFELK